MKIEDIIKFKVKRNNFSKMVFQGNINLTCTINPYRRADNKDELKRAIIKRMRKEIYGNIKQELIEIKLFHNSIGDRSLQYIDLSRKIDQMIERYK